jgi:Peptidase of plants and bacteria
MNNISIPVNEILWRTRGRNWEYCFLLTPTIDRGSWWRFYREVKAALSLSSSGDQAIGKIKDRAGQEHVYLASLYLDSQLIDAAGRDTEQFVVWFPSQNHFPESGVPENLARAFSSYFAAFINSPELSSLTDHDAAGADTIFKSLLDQAGIKEAGLSTSTTTDYRLIDVYHQLDGDLVLVPKKKRRLTPVIILFIVGTLLTLGFLALCQGQGQTRTVTKLVASQASGEMVATVLVDTQDAPDLADWGNEAGKKCLDWLPRLATLLPSEGFVPPKEVTLRFDPAYKGVAATQAGTITIAADWVRKHPEDFGMVIHELTHVVQDYRGKGEGWLTEGIADYIRYWIYEPGTKKIEINRVTSHYRQGYGTAAAFLDWIERTRAKGTVVKLNTASRAGHYREALFQEWFGKSLDALWAEFVKDTAAK